MREHLGFQQYLDQAPRWLPYNLYALDRGLASPVRVLNKTGFSVAARCDAAIVEAPTVTFVIATMADDLLDPGYYPDHPGNLVNARVVRLIFDYWVDPRTLDSEAVACAPLPRPL
jgi:hypothetical protein